MSDADDVLDCLIIGAGPGGLTAATYLVRYHRRILVVDAGKSRARWIPTSHNCPGFPRGVAGTTLLAQQREQAVGYGATIEDGCIAQLRRDGDAFEAVAADGRRWRATYVILATGIVDVMPPLDDLENAIASGAVRLCPVCDGYEASDCRVAVYGPVDSTISHALFLRTFSDDVTVVASNEEPASDDCLEQARRAGIPVHPMPAKLAFDDGKSVVRFADGKDEAFDTLYPTLGSTPNNDLAVQLDLELDDCGEIVVGEDQQTSVDGIYAVGDVVSALNQIAVAVGHAAIAATKIHNRLPRNWRERPELQGPSAQDLPSPPGTVAAATPKAVRD
ncbi:NAD(P)/FAD-dependent oxidoreductase [Lysobacter sp. TY2-98]|uniref:NAD(P)/FAD-dependent oxidoreductase n=1 Tax=Lysobacter sp. TY2-98 TaxID=2290922 RepID=UPI000E20328E|nr:NAD(P)/FAD-dependent oxidoreductase [Lysobacter sp. TY2-98]AXK73283.1 NAD(P)/FAD-dependent oxidoreductase [Lysobacter sp. TY2-98]